MPPHDQLDTMHRRGEEIFREYLISVLGVRVIMDVIDDHVIKGQIPMISVLVRVII